MSETVTRDAVQALLNLSTQGQLICAATNKPLAYLQHQAAAKALRGLLDGAGQQAAELHASRGGYQPAACLQTAWTRLPEGVERFTLAQVQQFLVAQGVEVTTDVISHGRLMTGHQLEDCEISTTYLDDQEAAARVVIDDCSSLHGMSSSETDMVVQGGAA